MCQLVTFSSYIVQFSAVNDFNQASSGATLSFLATHESSKWVERGERKRGRERKTDREVVSEVAQQLERKS